MVAVPIDSIGAGFDAFTWPLLLNFVKNNYQSKFANSEF
jgi:hypothetical protein